MRILVRALVLMMLLTSSFVGQTDNWKKYKNTDGNFTVLFPGEPQDSLNKKDDTLNSHTLMAQEKPALYMVVYSSMSQDQAVNDTNFRIFRDAVFKELPKCEVGPEQPVSPAVDGYIGHSYHLNCAMPNVEVAVTGNLYWGKRYAYAVMAMFPANVPQPQPVKMFVESFSVMDSAR